MAIENIKRIATKQPIDKEQPIDNGEYSGQERTLLQIKSVATKQNYRQENVIDQEVLLTRIIAE